MTEGDELLDKADALLSKYRPAPAPVAPLAPPAHPSDDFSADFPVLTEVVELPFSETVSAQAVSEWAVRAEDAPDLTDTAGDKAAQEDPSGIEPVEAELQELEHQLRHRILEAIEPRLAGLLGDALEQRIRSELDAAVGQIAGDVAAVIRSEAGNLVIRAVTEAVEDEFSKLRASLDKT